MRHILGIAALAAPLLLGAAPVSAQATDPIGVAMTDTQLETVLRARGYSDIQGMQRDGEVYRIERAQRYGEEVSDLRIDAVTGQVHDEQLTEGQARSMLRQRGFSEVTEIRREGDMIHARGTRAGSPAAVTINARTGSVTQATAGN